MTPAQIAAAMALGICFVAATPDQVQRLSMQRKIFRIDGVPHLTTRDGSFFETAATLERLIAYDVDYAQQADLAAWGGQRHSGPLPYRPANARHAVIPALGAACAQAGDPCPLRGRAHAGLQGR
jgi:hypothetical protein